MSKVFFLSHSTQDEPFVNAVAGSLGRDSCFYHPWETSAGDNIVQNVDQGIVECEVFVLFWSVCSSRSSWVEEETSMARTRLFLERGFRIVLVKLDGTEPPLAFAHRFMLDGVRGADYVAAELARLKKAAAPHAAQDVDPFQNRQTELADLERFGLSENYTGILVLGLAGMGKRSLIRRASKDIFRHLHPIWVDLRTESSPSRLLASIANALSIAIQPEEVADDAEGLWKTRLLPELKRATTHYLVLENYPNSDIAGDQRKKLHLIGEVCSDVAQLQKSNNPNFIIIALADPHLSANVRARMAPIRVRDLPLDYMRWALRARLAALRVTVLDDGKVTALARRLRGYPLAVNLVANKVAEQGIDAILDDAALLNEILKDLAQDLFAGIGLSEAEKKVLTLTATASAPTELDVMIRASGGDPRAIATLTAKQILHWNGSGYVVHEIVRDYVTEFLATAVEITRAHSILAKHYGAKWKDSDWLSSDSLRYGSLAYFHGIVAVGDNQSLPIRKVFLTETWEAGIELYRRRKYKEALTFLEKAREIDPDPDLINSFYYALCLNRRRRSEEALVILQQLCDTEPKVSRNWHALGTVQRELNRLEEAETSFRTSFKVASSPMGKAVPLASLAEVLADKGDIEEAISVVLRAHELAPRNSSVVVTTAKLLQRDNQLEKAYKILAEALRFNKNNSHLHFHIGMVLKQNKDFAEARRHLESATCDPTIPYSCTALADVYLELDKLDEAEGALKRFEGDKNNDASYLSTRGNILRKRGSLSDAEDLVRKANQKEPGNPIHFGGLAQIKLDQARKHFSERNKTVAELDLEEAIGFVSRGLELDPKNSILLTIQHSIDKFRSKAAMGNSG